MEIELWQVGVLLIGIGFLFFSVYLGMLFKEGAETVKDARKIVERNSREIDYIIGDTSQILSSVNTVTGVVSNISTTGVGKTVARTALSVAQMRRKRKARREK